VSIEEMGAGMNSSRLKQLEEGTYGNGRSSVCSGVSFRKEMDDTVYGRCVADVAHFETKVDILFQSFNFQRQDGSVREMIVEGTDGGEINRRNEQLHAGYPFDNNAELDLADNRIQRGARHIRCFSENCKA
jgi:hypothetical protein